MANERPTRDPFAGEGAILTCLATATVVSLNSTAFWGAYIGAKAHEIDDCLKAYQVTIADGFDKLAQAYESAAKLLTAPVLESLRLGNARARWQPPGEVVEAHFATSSQAAMGSVEGILWIPEQALPAASNSDWVEALSGLKPLPSTATEDEVKRRSEEWCAIARKTPVAERWRLLGEVLVAIRADRQYWTDIAESLQAVSSLTLGSLEAAVQTEWAHLRARHEEQHGNGGAGGTKKRKSKYDYVLKWVAKNPATCKGKNAGEQCRLFKSAHADAIARGDLFAPTAAGLRSARHYRENNPAK